MGKKIFTSLRSKSFQKSKPVQQKGRKFTQHAKRQSNATKVHGSKYSSVHDTLSFASVLD